MQTLQHEVASAALTGNPYNEIEERVIGPSPLSDEEKAALRLYSWSFLSRFELRRMALERLFDLSTQDQTDAHPERTEERGTVQTPAPQPPKGP